MKKLLAMLLIAVLALGLCACNKTLSAAEYCDRGDIFLSRGQYEKALNEFRMAQKAGGGERAFCGIAAAYMGLETYGLAADAYCSAADACTGENNIRAAELLRLASEAYEKAGRMEDADRIMALSNDLAAGDITAQSSLSSSAEASSGISSEESYAPPVEAQTDYLYDPVKEWISLRPDYTVVCSVGDRLCYISREGELIEYVGASSGERTLFKSDLKITGTDSYKDTVYFCTDNNSFTTSHFGESTIYSVRLDCSPVIELCTVPLANCSLVVDGNNLLIFGINLNYDASEPTAFRMAVSALDGSVVSEPELCSFPPFPTYAPITGQLIASADGKACCVKNGGLYRLYANSEEMLIAENVGDEIAAVEGSLVYCTNSTASNGIEATITRAVACNINTGECKEVNLNYENTDGRILEICTVYRGALVVRYERTDENGPIGSAYNRFNPDGTTTLLT